MTQDVGGEGQGQGDGESGIQVLNSDQVKISNICWVEKIVISQSFVKEDNFFRPVLETSDKKLS